MVNKSVIRVVLLTVSVLLVPLLAMQVTDEVTWGLGDFVVAGILLFSAGLTYELIKRKVNNLAYRAAIGIAVIAALALVWVNLAIGIIGSENDPANLMYLGVLAVGIIGAFVSRLQPGGMTRALLMTVLSQILVTCIALIFSLGETATLMLFNGVFVVLFSISALLFWHTAQRHSESGDS